MRTVSVYISPHSLLYIYWRIMQNFYWFDLRLLIRLTLCVLMLMFVFSLHISTQHITCTARHSVSISFVFQSARIFLRKYISILILIHFVILKNELCCLKDKHRIFATLIYVKEVFKLTKCLESDFGMCIPLYVIIL